MVRKFKLFPVLVLIIIMTGCGGQTSQNQISQQAVEWPESLKSEVARCAIWEEKTAAEDRALREAESTYPTKDLFGEDKEFQFQKQNKLLSELMEKYVTPIKEKYGLTEQLAEKLASEASEKRWPFGYWEAEE